MIMTPNVFVKNTKQNHTNTSQHQRHAHTHIGTQYEIKRETNRIVRTLYIIVGATYEIVGTPYELVILRIQCKFVRKPNEIVRQMIIH